MGPVRTALLLLALATASLSGARASEPVTADEARAVLDVIETAHRAEDADAIVALHAEPLRRRVGFLTRQLFKERNYLRLEQRIVGTSSRPDGSLVVDFVGVLRSRRATESFDRRSNAFAPPAPSSASSVRQPGVTQILEDRVHPVGDSSDLVVSDLVQERSEEYVRVPGWIVYWRAVVA